MNWVAAGKPSIAVVEVIAHRTGLDVLDMPPMYEYFDPEPFDALLTDAGAAGETLTVTAPYGGLTITASSDGTLDLSLES